MITWLSTICFIVYRPCRRAAYILIYDISDGQVDRLKGGITGNEIGGYNKLHTLFTEDWCSVMQ